MIQPPFLKQHSKIKIVAPAGKVAPGLIDNALLLLRSWGLRAEAGACAGEAYGGFAGSDEHRRRDFQAALDDADTAAVLCARGGYGCSRIIDSLDFSACLRAPKWVVGYSDITVVHARLQRLGLQSIHGPMPKDFPPGGRDNESTALLRRALFGELHTYTVPAHPFNRQGTATGRLLGGNLSLLASLAATVDEPATAGAILFLEEVDEPLYRVDRLLGSLQRSGKLSSLAGLIIGGFSEMRDDAFMTGTTVGEILATRLIPLGVPLCFAFPAGHYEPNYPLYLGRKISLEVTAGGSRITF
jgi:muramoyltetrapeptide carboxypeptidase